jgi:hypothetical protein
MFYLVLLTQLFGSPSLRQSLARAEESAFGKAIFDGFTTFLGVILGFFFVTRAVESVTRTIQAEQTRRAEVGAGATRAGAAAAAPGGTPAAARAAQETAND